jgi:hypothetical protein
MKAQREKGSAPACGSLRDRQAHRIVLRILAFDREIARISAYSRHKPFTQLPALGKAACGKGYPETLKASSRSHQFGVHIASRIKEGILVEMVVCVDVHTHGGACAPM